jgi:hypothetical protein
MVFSTSLAAYAEATEIGRLRESDSCFRVHRDSGKPNRLLSEPGSL